jgi:hypothetical protein
MIRKLMNDQHLTNRKIREKLRKSPDENSLDEEGKLFLFLKDLIEMQKKQLDKLWYSKKKWKNCSELFYKKFILKKKGVSLRKSLWEGIKNRALAHRWVLFSQ